MLKFEVWHYLVITQEYLLHKIRILKVFHNGKFHIKKVLKIHSGKDFLNGLDVTEKRFEDKSTMASSSQIWREIKIGTALDRGRMGGKEREWEWGRSAG